MCDICLLQGGGGLQLGQFMYYHKYSLLPERFASKFSESNQIHAFNTRNSINYRVPLCRTNIRQFSVYFQGPKCFNSLPRELVNIHSFILFKTKLKAYLTLNY
jgi:hypothetical protein